MSAQHTPAPWWVRTRAGHDGKMVDCFVAAKDVNGFAYDAEIMGDDEYRDDIERKLADANLIASAPDLVLERDTLKARVAELEGDAARFVFLFSAFINDKEEELLDLLEGAIADPKTLNDVRYAIDAAIAASKEAPNQTLPQGEQEPKPAFSKDALWGMEHLRAELRAKVEALPTSEDGGTYEKSPEDFKRDVLAEIDKLGDGV